jgi:hypothetical protein
MVRGSNDQFNRHIDQCLSGEVTVVSSVKSEATLSSSRQKFPTSSQASSGTGTSSVKAQPPARILPSRSTAINVVHSSSVPKQKTIVQRMSKTWYSGMKEAKLRNMMYELGLSTNGNKKVFSSRGVFEHHIFIIL